MNRPIKIKIDVTKIDKTALFKGKKRHLPRCRALAE